MSSLQEVFNWFGLPMTIVYGLCVGSFLNVVIYRVPLHESLSKSGSHCFSCGSSIKWYDNIPLVSWLLLGGRCRKCSSRISVQYPVVEFLNAFLWVLVYLRYQFSVETLIYFALTSALLALSVIDEKTYEIPVCFNYFILALGIIYTAYDYRHLVDHVIGAVCVSGFLFAVWWITRGRGLGFGDIKLMFTCGLVVGWKAVVVGFLVGCIIAIPVHLIRMKFSNRGNKLAFGSYLSLGIFISLFVGNEIMCLYLKLLGVV